MVITKTAFKKGALSPVKSTARTSLLAKLITYDRRVRSEHGLPIIIGVDEVGRGCLAGPVVAAAVCLPPMKMNTQLAKHLAELNDSKQLNGSQRELLSLTIRKHATWAIADATVAEIDELNIVHASLTAMRRAVHKLITSLSHNDPLVIVDGHMKIPDLPCRQLAVVKGDGLSASIAAASVIAKVHRDSFMRGLAETLPAYDWHNNKGYGSKSHRQAIVSHGLTVWHRKAFIAKLLADLNQLKIDL